MANSGDLEQKRDTDTSGVSRICSSHCTNKSEIKSQQERICCLGICPSSPSCVLHSRSFTVSFENLAVVGFAFKRLCCLHIFWSGTRSLTFGFGLIKTMPVKDFTTPRAVISNSREVYSLFSAHTGRSRMEFLILTLRL